MYATADDGIWHIDILTGEAVQLTDDRIKFFNVDKEWLYYESRSEPVDENGKLMDHSGSFYKVRLDGTEKQLISHLWPMNMYIPKGDWIYFLNVDKEEGSPDVSVTYLAKIRKDGTEFERLFEYHE